MMPSDAARRVLAAADESYAEATATMADHERSTFAPLRATMERNHIADKIKAVIAA